MQTVKVNLKNSQTILTRAIARAKEEKPLIRKTIEPGMYRVLSKNGSAWYHVYCAPTGEITCTCPARKPCKHCVAADNYHKFLTQPAPAPVFDHVPVIEPADQPEEHQTLAECVSTVACDRCATPFVPTQWEIDFVELEGGYYFCADCTEWQIEQSLVSAVYFTLSTSELEEGEEEGGPSHA